MDPMHFLNRLFDQILIGLAAFSCTLFFIVVFAISYQVIMRYFFNMPPLWVSDFVEYSMLSATLLGAPYVLKEERHIEVDLITGFLTPDHQIFMKIITSIAGIITCAILTWYSAITVWDNFTRGILVTKTLDFPKYIALLPIFIGAFLLTIQFFRRTLFYMSERKKTEKKRIEKILQGI
jgi:TRAP-type C4-dicarboxylate transport system permease small subunit